ncbi:hypothetical protein [uncultured Bilophila sp.]|uniref:hypothetical protein n=1 Tax=uncultured Bilophila sp. TaxID=529385 RepID=UPI00280AD7B7|nr:hypothetical protein [uncultured Bilophila sp.]
MWLFHLHSAVKIQPFYPIFPLAGSTAKAFSGYPFGTSRKKASTIFYNTAFKKAFESGPYFIGITPGCFARLAPGMRQETSFVFGCAIKMVDTFFFEVPRG